MLSVSFSAEVQAGRTLSINPFEFWHARGPSGLAWLAKDLACAPTSQAYVERIFSVCGLMIMMMMLYYINIRSKAGN